MVISARQNCWIRLKLDTFCCASALRHAMNTPVRTAPKRRENECKWIRTEAKKHKHILTCKRAELLEHRHAHLPQTLPGKHHFQALLLQHLDGLKPLPEQAPKQLSQIQTCMHILVYKLYLFYATLCLYICVYYLIIVINLINKYIFIN